jgi:hypothetical protein
MVPMQKILIAVALVLYMIGCGNSPKERVYIPQGRDTTLSQTPQVAGTGDAVESPDVTISAHTLPDHVTIMEVAALSTEGVALDIALSDNGKFAYIAAGDAGLVVVDIQNPYNPVVVGTYDTKDFVNHVDLVNGKAYVAYKAQTWESYTRVDAFDVHDPYDLKYLGHYEGFGDKNHKVVSHNGLVYYIDREGFKIVRKSDYQVVGRYDLFDTAYAFALYKGFAFVANGRNGLTVLKVQ